MNKMNRRRAMGNKFRFAAPLGAMILILAAIGLITVMIVSFNFTTRIMDNTGEKEKLEQALLPILMFDPAPFDKVADADEILLLQSSFWTTLRSKKANTYSYDELQMKFVPASDIDVTAAKLFGPDVKLKHQTFWNFDSSFVYDEETKVYHVPLTAQVGLYTPKVEKIVKKGDVYSLTVGYIPPTNIWSTDLNGKNYRPTPDKYMIYEVKKIKGGYQLVAIKDPPNTIQTSTSAQTSLSDIKSSTSQASLPPSSSVPIT